MVFHVQNRRLLLTAGAFIAAIVFSAFPGTSPDAQAAGCVKFVASNFDAPGDDNYMPQLNQEWVRVRNTCSTTQSIGGWKVNDYNKIHTYKFGSGTTIGAGATITLRSGRGLNTATTKYWQRTYGAVWNNTGPERAYLRNAGGTLVSSWSE